MKKAIVFFLFYPGLLLSFFVNAEGVTISGADESINAQEYRIGRAIYAPLVSVCYAYGLKLDWDHISMVAILTKGDNEIRLCVHSQVILINGKNNRMRNKVVLKNGVVIVPLSFSEETLKGIFKRDGVLERSDVPSEIYGVRRVVIDAGHGGKDPGALGKSGLKEKDVNLAIARMARDALESEGLEVIMTRDSDEFISLKRRAEIANEKEADFFVSIHSNAGMRRYQGAEVYYLSDALDENARALEAAENASLAFEEDSAIGMDKTLRAILWDIVYTENRAQSSELAQHILNSIDGRIPMVKNRGVKTARFYVLKFTNMPSVLVEVGFVTNLDEARRLDNNYYRQMLAEAIANGISSYKKVYEKTNGFTR